MIISSVHIGLCSFLPCVGSWLKHRTTACFFNLSPFNWQHWLLWSEQHGMQWNVILTFVTEASLIFWVGAQFWPAFVLPFVQRENQEQILLSQHVERRFER